MCRRVKILAFLPHATTFYVIHTHGYGVVVCVNHCAVCRMCKAAISLSTRTVAPLELPAHLRAKQHWLQPETAGRAHVPPERTIPFPGEITESDLINPLCSSGRGKCVYFTLAHWAPQVALWYVAKWTWNRNIPKCLFFSCLENSWEGFLLKKLALLN